MQENRKEEFIVAGLSAFWVAGVLTQLRVGFTLLNSRTSKPAPASVSTSKK
jgi:hypothetical protein